MSNIIRFYGKSNPFFEGSNFYHAPFKDFANTEWKTTEHYFQAMKFPPEANITVCIGDEDVTISVRKWIKMQATPAASAKEGRRRDLPMRTDWEEVKDEIMYKALRHKFTQNKNCLDALLATGDAELIEASPIDFYWGEGSDGSGKNMLGKLLMRLREEIRNGN